MIEEVDLLMWTKNGERFLSKVLKQIGEVIPHKMINQKILVDDSSTDRTVSIAESFNWSVHTNEKGGMVNGIRQAFSYVETPFFVSVEQDVVLADNWWKIIPKLLEDSRVAVAQGARVPSHPVLGAIYRYGMKRGTVGLNTIDNTIYNTEKIKEVGGMGREWDVFKE